MIKIISGKYRSRNIATPDEGTEPTKNRVREALFSAISNEVTNACVLDLFAGSGALGIEALSRGASICFFNDQSKDASKIISSNLSLLNINNCEVSTLPYESCLERYNDKVFNIVFLDPPYALKDSYQKTIEYLLQNKMLSNKYVIVLEYSGEIDINKGLFKEVRCYNYGKTNVMICRGEL